MRYIEKACWQVCDHKGDREVEAFRFQIDPYMPDWFLNMMISKEVITYPSGMVIIPRKDKDCIIPKGYFIVKGEISGVYAIEPEMFLATYKKENKPMKRAMISQPMNGLTDKQVKEVTNRAKAFLESNGYDVVDTFLTDEEYISGRLQKNGVKEIPLFFLAKSLEHMSLCDAVYFAKGWEYARGCKIEHDAAVAYGLEIIYE